MRRRGFIVPRRAGLCSEPPATRRQHHRVQRLRRADHGKMATIAQGGGTRCHAGRRHLQPGHRTDPPETPQRLRKGRHTCLSDRVVLGISHKHANAPHPLGLLCERGTRPCRRPGEHNDYRYAAGDAALYKAYATELVALSPDILLAGNTPAVEALRQQTRTLPIVFVLVSYPVELGFVQGLARPGGNVTGFSAYDAPIMGKWVQLLKEIALSVTRVTVIFDPGAAPFATFFNRSIEAAAPSFGISVTLAPVHEDAEIEEVIAAQAREWGG